MADQAAEAAAAAAAAAAQAAEQIGGQPVAPQVVRTIGEIIGDFTNALFQWGTANEAVFLASLPKSITQVSLAALLLGLAAALHAVFQNYIESSIKAHTKVEEYIDRDKKHKEKMDQRPKVEIEKPEKFDGKPENAIPFLTACLTYLHFKKETNWVNQILFVLSMVDGGKGKIGKQWVDSKYRMIYEREQLNAQRQEGEPEVPAVFESWADFERQFLDHFSLYEQKEVAQDVLESITMGNDTCENYTTRFKEAAIISGYNEEALLYKYKKGLNPALRRQVAQSHPTPTTRAEWEERALQADRQFRKERGLTNRNPKPAQPTKPKDPNAMDIDAANTQGTNQKPFCRICQQPGHWISGCSQAICGACREKGHIARNCPKGKNKGIRATESKEEQGFS